MPNQANGYSRKYWRRWVSGKAVAADAAGAVGADQVVAADLLRLARGVGEQDAGVLAGHVDDGDLADVVPHVAAVALAGVGEVDEHVGLRVELDRGADQVLEVDAVALAAEGQLDALVPVAVAQHPVGDAGLDEHPDAVLLEDPGAVGVLDLLAGADLDDDRLDARAREQVGEHQSGRAAADDADGGAGHLGWHGVEYAASYESVTMRQLPFSGTGRPRRPGRPGRGRCCGRRPASPTRAAPGPS